MEALRKLRDNAKQYIENLSHDGFQQIFERIDQLNVKKGVDRLGLDKFIEQCAYLAAGSGVISGSGGLFTMIVGIPVDFINLITQQFRITMAIMYHERGTYEVGFNEFMQLVAASLKVEAGIAITKTMMESVAEKMLLMFGTRTAERLIPIVGGAIGGATNYLFIKRMAKMIKQMQMDPVIIEII